jgi:hypothetical protein
MPPAQKPECASFLVRLQVDSPQEGQEDAVRVFVRHLGTGREENLSDLGVLGARLLHYIGSNVTPGAVLSLGSHSSYIP